MHFYTRYLRLRLAFLMLVSVLTLHAQEGPDTGFRWHPPVGSDDGVFFNVRAFNAAADSIDMSRLIVQVTFDYDQLQFVKTGKKQFRADYEGSITLSDTAGSEVATTTWKGSIQVSDFKQTNSVSDFETSFAELAAPPGDYKVKIKIDDVETGRSGLRQGSVRLRDFFDGKMTLSDLLFLKSIAFLYDEFGLEMPPEESADSDTAGLFAYVEIYNVPAGDTIVVNYEILKDGGDTLLTDNQRPASAGQITKTFVRLPASVVSQTPLLARVTVLHGADSLQVEQALGGFKRQRPSVYLDLADSIEKLELIVGKKEVRRMLALKGEEQIKAFEAFWAARDPMKDTVENEYMEEFYRRIELANQRFKGYEDGWRTDMGMVLVKLGLPQYTDRGFVDTFNDPMASRYPPVIWYYPNFNRRVIFEYQGSEYRIANYSEVFDLLSGEIHL